MGKYNIWKGIALIFIILFIAETVFLGYIFYSGSKMVEGEEICTEYCLENNASFYDYDMLSRKCNCFNKESEYVKGMKVSK